MTASQSKAAKVLLVDDEPNILVALEFLMTQEGHHVLLARDGEDAVEKALAFLPDVVLLDVMMPGHDGLEVARQLRNLPELEHTRIIFLTARGTAQDKQQGYKSGGEVYLTKPFDNEALVTLVNEVITYG